MELQHIALAISVANFVLTWGVALYMYLANKDKATNGRISELQRDIDGKLDDHAERITALEARAESAPTHEDLGGIHSKINEVSDQCAALAGEFKGVRSLLTTIHEHLLRSGK